MSGEAPIETQSYVCILKSGEQITITGVARAEKDGSGRRFYNTDGQVIAAFDDGQSVSHYPSSAPVIAPPPVEPEPEEDPENGGEE